MIAYTEIIYQACIERELKIEAFLFAVMESVSYITDECGVNQDVFADRGSTHANVKNRCPNSFGIVITLEEINGAEQNIKMRIVINERCGVIAVFIWICFVVIEETK